MAPTGPLCVQVTCRDTCGGPLYGFEAVTNVARQAVNALVPSPHFAFVTTRDQMKAVAGSAGRARNAPVWGRVSVRDEVRVGHGAPPLIW